MRGVLARQPHGLARSHFGREQDREANRVTPRIEPRRHRFEPPESHGTEPGLLAQLPERAADRRFERPDLARDRLPDPGEPARRAPSERQELDPTGAPP